MKVLRMQLVFSRPLKATFLVDLFQSRFKRLLCIGGVLSLQYHPVQARPLPLHDASAHVITHCPPRVSPAIVSETPRCVCIMYDSVFSHSSSAVTAYSRHVWSPASGMMHARRERPEDVSGGGGRERSACLLLLTLPGRL